MITIKDQVICLRNAANANNAPDWYCAVSGATFGPFTTKGAALAGMHTEQRRELARITKAIERSQCTTNKPLASG